MSSLSLGMGVGLVDGDFFTDGAPISPIISIVHFPVTTNCTPSNVESGIDCELVSRMFVIIVTFSSRNSGFFTVGFSKTIMLTSIILEDSMFLIVGSGGGVISWRFINLLAIFALLVGKRLMFVNMNSVSASFVNSSSIDCSSHYKQLYLVKSDP